MVITARLDFGLSSATWFALRFSTTQKTIRALATAISGSFRPAVFGQAKLFVTDLVVFPGGNTTVSEVCRGDEISGCDCNHGTQEGRKGIHGILRFMLLDFAIDPEIPGFEG